MNIDQILAGVTVTQSSYHDVDADAYSSVMTSDDDNDSCGDVTTQSHSGADYQQSRTGGVSSSRSKKRRTSSSSSMTSSSYKRGRGRGGGEGEEEDGVGRVDVQRLRLKINGRERKRMHDLNSALDGLREVYKPFIHKIFQTWESRIADD